jgi:hypothetical protein
VLGGIKQAGGTRVIMKECMYKGRLCVCKEYEYSWGRVKQVSY